MERVDVDLGRIAARQHGLVTRAQAQRAGASEAAVRHRVAGGRWATVDSGVYRIAGAPVTWESSVMAAVLALGPGAVASHRSAAVLWQLDGVRPGRPEGRSTVGATCAARPPHACTAAPTCTSPSPPASVASRSRPRGARCSTWVPSSPPARCTSPSTTPGGGGSVDWAGLAEVLAGHARRGRPGVAALRALLEAQAGEAAVTDSMFERLVVAALLVAGLPAPVLQHEVVAGGRRFRLDLAYPPARLGIELDGSGHLRRSVWEADHARQNALVLAGWTILRFTWHDYVDRRPALVAEVRRALVTAA